MPLHEKVLGKDDAKTLFYIALIATGVDGLIRMRLEKMEHPIMEVADTLCTQSAFTGPIDSSQAKRNTEESSKTIEGAVQTILTNAEFLFRRDIPNRGGRKSFCQGQS